MIGTFYWRYMADNSSTYNHICSAHSAQCISKIRWVKFEMSADEKKDIAEKAPFLAADAVKSEAGENEGYKKEKEYLATQEDEDDENDITCGFWIFKGPLMQRY